VHKARRVAVPLKLWGPSSTKIHRAPQNKCASDALGGSTAASDALCSEGRDGFLLELGPQSFSGTATLRALCTDSPSQSNCCRLRRTRRATS